MTTVINVKSNEKDYVFCGRGTIFGNPYIIGRDGNRQQVVQKYQQWFNHCMKDDRFKSEILKLKDKKTCMLLQTSDVSLWYYCGIFK